MSVAAADARATEGDAQSKARPRSGRWSQGRPPMGERRRARGRTSCHAGKRGNQQGGGTARGDGGPGVLCCAGHEASRVGAPANRLGWEAGGSCRGAGAGAAPPALNTACARGARPRVQSDTRPLWRMHRGSELQICSVGPCSAANPGRVKTPRRHGCHGLECFLLHRSHAVGGRPSTPFPFTAHEFNFHANGRCIVPLCCLHHFRLASHLADSSTVLRRPWNRRLTASVPWGGQGWPSGSDRATCGRATAAWPCSPRPCRRGKRSRRSLWLCPHHGRDPLQLGLDLAEGVADRILSARQRGLGNHLAKSRRSRLKGFLGPSWPETQRSMAKHGG